MADYYPVLKRAISSLPAGSGEARRAVYEKARAALLRQLNSYNPPLSPSDITDQRMALEDCIRRVEAEVAEAAFGLTPEAQRRPEPAAPPAPTPPAPRAPERPPVEASRPEPKRPEPPRPEVARREAPPRAEVTETPVPPPAVPRQELPEPVAHPQSSAKASPTPPEPQRPARPQPAPPRVEPSVAEIAAEELPTPVAVKVAPPPITPDPPAERPRQKSVQRRPLEDRADQRIGAGLSALSRTLRQAGTLGEASATAVRVARQAIDDDAPEDAGPVKLEPEFTERPAARRELRPGRTRSEPRIEPIARAPAAADAAGDEGQAEAADTSFSREAPSAAVLWPDEAARPGRRLRLILAAVALVILVVLAATAFAFRSDLTALLSPAATETASPQPAASTTGENEPKIMDRLPSEGDTPVAPDAQTVRTEQVTPQASVDPDLPPPPAGESAVVAPVQPTAPAQTTAPAPAASSALAPEPNSAAEAFQASDAAPVPGANAGTTPTEPPAVTTAPEPATPTLPAAPAPAAPATAAQPVTEPATAAPQAGPTVLVAQKAILYEEPIPGSPGSKLEGHVLWSFVTAPVPEIKADIEIPDLALKLTLLLHKNADASLPASHIAELNFDIPASFPGRGIEMAAGMIAKQTEDARGDPVEVVVAKVSDEVFWLVLSGIEQDMQRNITLLKERQWFDLPIRYVNRRRAILTFEKGSQGDKVFEQALQAWGQ